MPPKNPPPKRNALDFIPPGTKRGDVVSFEPLPPDYVTELRDSPDDFSNPLKVGRMLPGRRVALTLSGWPFKFIVRVVPDEDGKSQVVDLRIHSPSALGDVPITNADLKAVPVAGLAATAMDPKIPGVEITREVVQPAIRRPGRPTKLTDDFLREVTRLAREAYGKDELPTVDNYKSPMNGYIVAGMKRAGLVDFDADEETVRGWRKAATARRQQSPDDDSFLRSGELRGKPRKDASK